MKRTNKYNIYDFDQTIYNGNSTLDFYIFVMKLDPKILKYVPFQLWHILLFLLKRENKTIAKGKILVFLRDITDINSMVDNFWDQNYQKMKKWYLTNEHATDIIISASPSFLLKPIFENLGAYKLIATTVNVNTGIIQGNNCYGIEKLRRLKLETQGLIFGQAYSDSLSDLPILEIAENAFIVKGDLIVPLTEYRNS